MIMTDMLKIVNQDAINAIASSKVPLKSVGDVSEIAEALEYIIKASYLTGQVISPNGGYFLQ